MIAVYSPRGRFISYRALCWQPSTITCPLKTPLLNSLSAWRTLWNSFPEGFQGNVMLSQAIATYFWSFLSLIFAPDLSLSRVNGATYWEVARPIVGHSHVIRASHNNARCIVAFQLGHCPLTLSKAFHQYFNFCKRKIKHTIERLRLKTWVWSNRPRLFFVLYKTATSEHFKPCHFASWPIECIWWISQILDNCSFLNLWKFNKFHPTDNKCFSAFFLPRIHGFESIILWPLIFPHLR